MMKKILVVEDQLEVRSNLIELLEAENFLALGAEDGLEGVNLAKEIHPDLIVCDVMMPDFDGYDVLNMLHQDPETSTIPFIFLTAKTDVKDIRQGMNLGADDYLAKPFTRLEILQAINTRLSKQTRVTQQADRKIAGLRRSLTYTVPDKILNPLDEILGSAKILIEDAHHINPQDIAQLSQHIDIQARFLQRAIQNFFLYMHIEFLTQDYAEIQALIQSYTMRPGDFIYIVAMQKAKQYGRFRDLKVDTENIPLSVATDDLKKTVEECLDFIFSASSSSNPILLKTQVQSDVKFSYTIQSDIQEESIHALLMQLNASAPLERTFCETLDPGLGLLLTQRIATLYGGEMTLSYDSIPQHLKLTVSLPIKPSNPSL